MASEGASDRYAAEIAQFAQAAATLDDALASRAKTREAIAALVRNEAVMTSAVRQARKRANDARQALLYSLWKDAKAWDDTDEDDDP